MNDERLHGALRDAAAQAHGFMHYGIFTDCEAEICVRRFALLRVAPEPTLDRAAIEQEAVANFKREAATEVHDMKGHVHRAEFGGFTPSCVPRAAVLALLGEPNDD